MDDIKNFLYSMKKPLTMEEICTLIDANNDEEKQKLVNILNDEVKKYNIIKTRNNRYIPLSKTHYKKGKFSAYKNTGGKVTVINSYIDKNGELRSEKNSYIIKGKNNKYAIDGDIVLIEKKDKNEYVINKVIERQINTILGEVFQSDGKYYIKSNDKKKQDLMVLLDKEAIEGDCVIASLDKRIDSNLYSGSVKKIISHKNSAEAEFIELAYKLGIEAFFSDEALYEASLIPTKVLEEDKKDRLILTSQNIFTIDREDTKDMDDAISIDILDNGNYLFGAHIADPTYYVKEGSNIDKEAIARGTSVYAYNQVIPMLPTVLSNGICSLNPNVERLTISTLMEITQEGEIVDFLMDQAVIKSGKKMTYADVNKILEENTVPPDYEKFVKDIMNIYKLYLVVKRKAIEDGMIDIDKAEPNFCIENGKLEYNLKKQRSAEDIIEFLMLTVNAEVSKYMKKHNIPIINRVHEAPDTDKIRNFINYIKNFGIIYDKHVEMNSQYFQELVSKANEYEDVKDIVLTEFVKSLKRACYSTDALGHFALGKDDYVHFTSPIRRGPDYILHRQIRELILSKKNNEENRRRWALKLPTLAYQFSVAEQKATELERIAEKNQAHDYMMGHVGEEYNGIITSFEYAYMNVQLDNLIEGRVNYEDLDNVYVLSKDRQKLVGTDDEYKIGDKLKVSVKEFTDEENRNIYFDIISKTCYNKNAEEKQLVKTAAKKYVDNSIY